MYYPVLKPIEATTKLAALFNSFMGKLDLLQAIALPRETMAEYSDLLIDEPTGPIILTDSVPKTYQQLEQRRQYYYGLAVLTNSLHGFHAAIVGARQLLTTFTEQHGGCLVAYQAATGRALHVDLSQFFHEPGAPNGELIGSSDSGEDFRLFSAIVENAEALSPVAFLRQQGATLVPMQAGEDGELRPATLGETVEHQMRRDLANESLANQFWQIWGLGGQAALFYRQLSTDDPQPYHKLAWGLDVLLDLRFSELTPPSGR